MVAAKKAKAAEKPKELQTTRTSGPASPKGAAMNTSSAVAKKLSSSAAAKKKGRGATHQVSCSASSSDASSDSSGKSEESDRKSPEYDAFDDERTKELKAEDCAAADATEKPKKKARLRSRSRGQTSRSSAVATHRPDSPNGAPYNKIRKKTVFLLRQQRASEEVSQEIRRSNAHKRCKSNTQLVRPVLEP